MLGICVAAVSLFYFFYVEKAEAEKRMVEIVNYVKVQCSTYTHYNESSESKSLLRAIESARQMSTNINMETENGGQLSREFLKENLQTLWVDGIIVLDQEGKTDCEYSEDESLASEITDYLQKGENTVKIEVVNNWVNRLIGDLKLPAEQRSTWTMVNPWRDDSQLQSSGLFGPVRIESHDYELLKFSPLSDN